MRTDLTKSEVIDQICEFVMAKLRHRVDSELILLKCVV